MFVITGSEAHSSFPNSFTSASLEESTTGLSLDQVWTFPTISVVVMQSEVDSDGLQVIVLMHHPATLEPTDG